VDALQRRRVRRDTCAALASTARGEQGGVTPEIGALADPHKGY
jgi:hypothetical protein